MLTDPHLRHGQVPVVPEQHCAVQRTSGELVLGQLQMRCHQPLVLRQASCGLQGGLQPGSLDLAEVPHEEPATFVGGDPELKVVVEPDVQLRGGLVREALLPLLAAHGGLAPLLELLGPLAVVEVLHGAGVQDVEEDLPVWLLVSTSLTTFGVEAELALLLKLALLLIPESPHNEHPVAEQGGKVLEIRIPVHGQNLEKGLALLVAVRLLRQLWRYRLGRVHRHRRRPEVHRLGALDRGHHLQVGDPVHFLDGGAHVLGPVNEGVPGDLLVNGTSGPGGKSHGHLVAFVHCDLGTLDEVIHQLAPVHRPGFLVLPCVLGL
mmetsp:Transcript_103228/g.287318  ORF Transcript_103228/g.287318 Transcript_103228/m.287318 type:complete len:320 (-) Transcript_103228:165-1124(-)